jgi:hypothetical protein
MALPHARKIEVDGKTYEWIVKAAKPGRSADDSWGNDITLYDRRVTIRSQENGKLVQTDLETQSVTPETVIGLIRENVQRGAL